MRGSLPQFRSKRFLLKVITALFTFIILSNTAQAVVKTSTGDGNWNVAGTWNPAAVPSAADDVTINNKITINSGETYTVNSVTINGTLTVNGTLIINSDLTTGVDGVLEMGNAAVVIVKGNATLGNRAVFDLSSYFIVLGKFTKLGAANHGSITANNAHIYILGTVSTPYTFFTICDSYSGTTANTNSDCDGGTFDALISNETGNSNPVISEAVQEAITSSTTLVNYLSPASACFCSGGSTTLTINEPGTISTLKWYNGTTLLSTVSNPSNPYSRTVNQAGTYSAIYKVGTTWYQTYPPAEVTVSSVPTATISGSKTICQGESATLSIVLTGTGPWNFTYSDGTTATTVTSQATSPFTVSVSPATTKTYTITSVSTACCSGTTSGSAKITVTPEVIAGVSIAASSNNICTGAFVTFTATAANGGTSPSYQWRVNGINAGTNDPIFSYVPANNDVVTCILTSNAGCVTGNPATSNAVTVAVIPGNTITAPSTTTFCETSGSSNITIVGSDMGSGASYQWQRCNDPYNLDNVYSYSDISGANSKDYNPGTITATVGYRRNVTGSCASSSNIVKLFVTPAILNTIVPSTATSKCGTIYEYNIGGTPSGGNNNNFTFQWQSSSDGSTFSDISNAQSQQYSPGLISTPTYFRRIAYSGYCTSLSNVLFYNTNKIPDSPGAITGNTTVCGSFSGEAYSVVAVDGATSYSWSYSGTGISINGSGNNVTVDFANNATSGTLSVRATNDCGSSGPSSLDITVNSTPTPTFTVSPGAQECQNDDVVYTTQSGQSNYVWNVSGTAGVDYSITSGGISPTNYTVTIKWLTTGNKTVTVNYDNSGGCSGGTPATSTTTIDPIPEIGSFN